MGAFMRNVVCMQCYVREFICVVRILETVLFKVILSYCSDVVMDSTIL